MLLFTTLMVVGLAAEPGAQLAEVGWLAGSWRGTMAGGQIEEVWTPASGGTMMGMFRMQSPKGPAIFYEFQVIEQTAEGVSLKIKHFNRLLKGQEEQEKFAHFKLTKASADQALFEADEPDATVTLVYKRLAKDRLDVDFHKVAKSTGKEQKMVFSFEKAPQ